MLSNELSNADRAGIETGKLFSLGGLEDVAHLLDACAIKTIASSDHLLEPGAPNSSLYLVLDGELLVYPDGTGLPESVALGPGDCAGEMSLIHGPEASALVVAARDTRLLVIPHDILWSMIDRSHGVARNLLAILAGRMRNDNLTLVASQSHSLEFEQAASVDALTGLHNRRWMLDAFPRAMRRCERDEMPLCLILADIDHFKRLNERYGHPAGDNVLRMVARQLVDGLRSQDLLVRYGGEEFALLLPQTSIEEGIRIAERLRLAIAAQTVQVSDKATESVTISCGITFMGLAATFDDLLTSADTALLRAKQNGRNRVERSG